MGEAGPGMYPGSVLAGTPPRPLSGSDSPPPLPTSWATMKHPEDPEVRGPQRDWGDGRPRGHIVLTPPSLPEIVLPWAAPDPQGARKCPPASLQPHRPLPGASLPASCLPQMGACFSKVFNGCPLRIHAAVTWIHPATRGRPGAGRSQGIPSLGQGS